MIYSELEIIYSCIKEYYIYSKVLGYNFELGKAYNSPFRDDSKPSFVIYRKRILDNSFEFFWKDYGVNKSGSIVDLYILCYHISKNDAIKKILEDDYSNIKDFIVKDNSTDIRITSRCFNENELKFWSDINVNLNLLNYFNVKPFDNFYVNRLQYMPFYYSGMSFAYCYKNKYQLYFPYNNERKFVNEWDDSMIIGEDKLLVHSDTLIITKSYKDMICLTSLGYASLSVRSENIFCDFSKFKYRYKKIYVLFDNDGKHIGNKYKFKLIELESAKDISDLIKLVGVIEANNELKKVMNK